MLATIAVGVAVDMGAAPAPYVMTVAVAALAASKKAVGAESQSEFTLLEIALFAKMIFQPGDLHFAPPLWFRHLQPGINIVLG